ncbi:DUF7010 family protein [Pontixanthobacter luteolus]|uniref:DUF7010 family protein n=1 Tax=Pontixanthobacter luteolus TaxID=295089 RepID=UPI002302F4C1|nr:hypothetical protein [Pontixanthobacter luteolus]
MQISEAQSDLSRAYTGGGPGVIISGLIWTAAWLAETRAGIATGFGVLFFGGMLIYPAALLVNRVFLKRAKELAGNPGGPLVMESTIAMIAGLFAAWLFLKYDPALVMPLSAIMVGTHYFAFRTAYGDKLFWLLAALVTVAGFAGIYSFVPLPGGVTLTVAIIEVLFGVFLTWRNLR